MGKATTVSLDGTHAIRDVKLSFGRRRIVPVAIKEASEAVRLFEGLIDRHADREHFAVLCLDARCAPLGYREVSVGTLTTTLVHPREVFRPALILGAASIMCCHNHPAGDPEPSPEDLALTERLVRAGALLGIPLIDHLIIGAESFASLRTRHASVFAVTHWASAVTA